MLYTARSEHYSVFIGGIFSNKNMNWAVLISAALLLLVVYLPPLRGIFETAPMTWAHWKYILPLAILPAIAVEITKYFILRSLLKKQAAVGDLRISISKKRGSQFGSLF